MLKHKTIVGAHDRANPNLTAKFILAKPIPKNFYGRKINLKTLI